MSRRKWWAACLAVLAGAAACAVYAYVRLVSPEAVRRQVAEQLAERLQGAVVSVGSASLSLWGGIAVRDLRIALRDDPARNEVAYVPTATFHYDAERFRRGRVIIVAIDLVQPQVRAVRGVDGRWNVARIRCVPRPDEPLPAITVKRGRVRVEDAVAWPRLPAVEIGDVSLSVRNDPPEALQFSGSGRGAGGGTVEVKGSRALRSGEASVSVQAMSVAVDSALLKRLGAYWPAMQQDAQHLRGTATVRTQLMYRPAAARPWTVAARAQLSNGRFSHPQLPLRLEDVEASAAWAEGTLTLERLTARSGAALVELRAEVQTAGPEPEFGGTLLVAHLPVGPALFAHLPAGLKKIEADFAPAGPVQLAVRFARREGRWSQYAVIRPEDLSISFVKFPYPVEHITGTLEQELDPARDVDVVRMDLAGLAGQRQVFIRGDVTGDGPAAAVAVRIRADNVPLDDRLRAALPPRQQRLAASFHPIGLADVDVSVSRAAGGHEFANTYRIRFHGASARYDEFPYPLEEVSGLLEIRPEGFEFSDFRGTHKGGEVRTHGRSRPTPQGDALEVHVAGDNILVDRELEAALKPELREAWALFRPADQGRMKFRADVERAPDQAPEIDVTVAASGCTIQPEFFPYALRQLEGTFRYARRWVYVKDMRARHGASAVSLDEGKVYLKPGGGVWADLVNLRGTPLAPDPDLLAALPRALQSVFDVLEVQQPFGLEAHLTIDAPPGHAAPPVVYWDGRVTLADASFRAGIPVRHVRGEAACRGRHNGHVLEGLVGNVALTEATVFGQPLQDVQAALEVRKDTPGVLAVPGLHARLFGGELYGPVRVEFGPPARYEVDLTAAQVRLEDLGRHNLGAGAGQWSGLATARLHLRGRGAAPAGMEGQGTIDVPNGKLYNLPLLLDLLKFLGLRLPDGTAFEEAHAVFGIRGTRVLVSRLDLFGNSVSLRGQGEMDLDGTDIKLDFYAVWARIVQYLPPIIRDIPPYLSQHLLKIKMRGSVSNLHFTKEPVPVLVDPLRELLERVGGRRGRPGRPID